MRISFYWHLAWRVAANKLRRKLGYPAIPYKVIWNTTYYCNSRCKTCNIWQIYPLNGGSQKDELEPAEVSRIATSLGKNLLWLTMTGGEPTLKRHLAETVNAIYDACPRLAFITVNSNAILPKQTVKVVEAIAAHCRRAEVHAVLSIDGVGAVHDEVRGVPGNFQAIVQTYRSLTERKERLPNLRIGFQSTVSRYNLNHLAELLDFCRHRGDEHSITFAQEAELYHNHGDGQDVTAHCAVLPRVLEDLTARYRMRHPREVLQWAHLRLMRGFIATRRAPVSCTAGSSSVTLGPKGEVTGCLFLDNRIGNAKEYGYDLMRMIRSERAEAVQTACSGCSQCWTNCESFPSMLSSPFQTLVRALRPRPRWRLAGKKSVTGEALAILEPVVPT